MGDRRRRKFEVLSRGRAPRAGAEELQYIQLVKIMEGITLFDSKDRWIWSLEGCGEFTVASVRNLLDANTRARISVKKEAPVNFLTDPSDGRSTLRPADVLVFGWVGGRHACVDLTGVSSLVGLSSRGFTVGQAALKAASCKVTKHEKTCIENQHVFIPFAFDTFGFLAPEAVEILTRVQRVMNLVMF
ncbi:hypothetical protein Tco_0608956 [Tanacetum coccineum]